MRIEKILCDRCGAEVNYPAKRTLHLSGVGYEGGIDLCDECHYELNVWFNNDWIEEGDNNEDK